MGRVVTPAVQRARHTWAQGETRLRAYGSHPARGMLEPEPVVLHCWGIADGLVSVLSWGHISVLMLEGLRACSSRKGSV